MLQNIVPKIGCIGQETVVAASIVGIPILVVGMACHLNGTAAAAAKGQEKIFQYSIQNRNLGGSNSKSFSNGTAQKNAQKEEIKAKQVPNQGHNPSREQKHENIGNGGKDNDGHASSSGSLSTGR